ncbi:Viral cathepsin [Papilio xuthus]|uniref:Viral cathepsin n=1 Tax=Papilio xuthus TaxID=66420 RepID=A0A194Q0M7_PAPXU|nr:Viral cathepsin [Papilio xuthus]
MLKFILLITIFIIVVGALDLNRLNKGLIEPSSVSYDIENSKQLFEEFIEKYNKKYDRNEYDHRYEIFVNNLEGINENNKNSKSAIHGVTKFADLTHEEFTAKYTGFAISGRRSDFDNTTIEVETLLDSMEAPEEFDWRDKNVVTEVKDQSTCNSCWAFSATGLTESQYAIKYSGLLSLSEKPMIDCWPKSGGCEIGNTPHAGINAAAEMGGFMLESDYPYAPQVDNCSFQKDKVAVRVKRGYQVTVNDEEQLKRLIHQKGPVSIALYAYSGFSTYSGQIMDGSKCPASASANHAMLIVGYGVENGTPYWIIKNSYSTHWGDRGYLKLIRGVKACDLLSYVAMAEVE